MKHERYFAGESMEETFKKDLLTIRVFATKKELGEAAAHLGEKLVNYAITTHGGASIILATGASQFELLQFLVDKPIDWSRVTAFHLDEYIGIPSHHPGSFRKYLCDRVFSRVKVKEYHLIQGDHDNPQNECDRISKVFDQYRIDVAFIGIGENGHIAFNDPPASFDDKVSYKVVQLDERCRQQQFNEGWFETIDAVPRSAITMSIPAIMRSRAVVCTVPDVRKAAAVRDALSLPVSPIIPASILRMHQNATLLLDQPAASLWKSR
jgi:glucosamine-6-phosphate deaminase